MASYSLSYIRTKNATFVPKAFINNFNNIAIKAASILAQLSRYRERKSLFQDIYLSKALRKIT